jgi:hypothetical protein
MDKENLYKPRAELIAERNAALARVKELEAELTRVAP